MNHYFVLAHHLELQHVPVVLIIAVAGAWIGWNMASKWLRK